MRSKHRSLLAVACAAILALVGTQTRADQRDQAKRMYDRIAGVPPSDTMLNTLAGMDLQSAALKATQDASFYNNTLRNLAAPWTNRDQSVFVPMNDYIATVIGMVKDDVPFNQLLSGDIIYTADGSSGAPAYSTSNNAMYQFLDDNQVDLSGSHLVRQTQSAVTGLPAAAVAGVMTTRAAAQAFFINGTNRAMFRFTMMNHLCSDLQTIPDTSRPPDRIRQDVTRSPGGDSSLFLNNCIECHSGMDPMAQAFAYYDFQHDPVADPTGLAGQILYTAGKVQGKYTINATNFPQGFVTPDDSWENRWRISGPNKLLLGFDSTLPGAGNGAASLGKELAASDAFASCQVTRVFKYVCFRAPSDAADRTQIGTMTATFKSGYSLRRAFADAAVYCTTPGN